MTRILRTLWTGGLLGLAAITLLAPERAFGQAQTCNGLTTIDYVSGPNYAIPGDVLRVRLSLGTGSINGGMNLTINRLRFDLDCNANFPLAFPCIDEGAYVQYEGDGTITDSCGKTWTTGHAVSSAPNQVVFTPDTPVVIPANQSIPPGFCSVEFDVRVLAAPSLDLSPNFIEEVGGYSLIDGVCDNGRLVSGGSQSSAIPLCPICDDGNECTADACDQTTGQCVFTPTAAGSACSDTDGSLCTSPACDGSGTCNQTATTVTCTPDGNDCTAPPTCNPATGLCEEPPTPLGSPCGDTDGNACTSPACDGAGTCNQNATTIVCTPDGNECTLDPACNPANGLCEKPPTPAGSPCTDTDNNACTTAACDGAGTCNQGANPVVCTPDGNDCTLDPACNPANGLCEKPPTPAGSPCADSDGNACTNPACDGAGACNQTASSVVCTPDTNDCTQPPTCNPANGQCEEPPTPPGSACADTDNNACTTAACDGSGTCNQSASTVTCTPDTNPCTQPPTCNPANGQCAEPPVPDGTTCPDTDGDVCTIAACVAGACSQSAQTDPTCRDLDHFTCYEIKPFLFTSPPPASLVDRYGATTVTVRRPNKLCAPANKNGEDPAAPTNPDHLTAYPIRNPAIKVTNQTVSNQFGTVKLDVVKTDMLLVPTAKSLAPPAPPEPLDPEPDHFQCYKAKRSKGTPRFTKILGVTVEDQFGSGTFDLIKPTKLCAPVNKNNEEPGAEAHTGFLLCYRVKSRAPFNTQQVWLGNQFGPLNDETLTRRQEFCVPSTLAP